MPRPFDLSRFQQVVHYDPETGFFTNRKSGRKLGSRHSRGYIEIGFDGESYLAHRLAWMTVYWSWPAENIDHINRDKQDNRLSNLRECNQAENEQNQALDGRKANGLLGITQRASGRWTAQIHQGGQRYVLGTYDTPELAHEVYMQAKMKLHRFYASGAAQKVAHDA